MSEAAAEDGAVKVRMLVLLVSNANGVGLTTVGSYSSPDACESAAHDARHAFEQPLFSVTAQCLVGEVPDTALVMAPMPAPVPPEPEPMMLRRQHKNLLHPHDEKQ